MEFSIPFSGRSHYYTESEIETVVATMRNAVPLTQGSNLQEFEKKCCHYVGAEHVFAVSNATAALEIAARLCQFEPGDEVVIPAHTFTSSAYPFVKAGGAIVWADIDPDTRVVTADTIAPCVGPMTRAIVVPHLYGFGADMPQIMNLADEHKLIVIEDAAQAVGVKIKGQMAGTFGHLGVYSFHSHKNMTTLGEGGMLVVRVPEWVQIIPMLRHNGHQPYALDRLDYWLPAMTDVALPELNGKRLWPMNCCLGEVECAVGVKLLDRIDQINNQKRIRALSVIDALADCSELVFHREASERHNYHLLAARVENGLRDRFIRRMAAHHGIQCVVQYYPLNRYPFYCGLGFGEAKLPHTDAFFDNMVSLPFNHLLTDDEIELIIAASRETLEFLRS
jgi:dTDP-4-amino-4,6-dideoxygalactose transaminase